MAISALITSYARIFINKIKLLILQHKAIFTIWILIVLLQIFFLENLDNNLVGPGLAQFKLEYLIKEGYFISNKLYGLILENKEEEGEDANILNKDNKLEGIDNKNSKKKSKKYVIKAKGIDSNSITIEQIQSMY